MSQTKYRRVICQHEIAMRLKLMLSRLDAPFFAGISRLRGVVMYELQSTLSAYARRKYGNGEISVDHLKNILKVPII